VTSIKLHASKFALVPKFAKAAEQQLEATGIEATRHNVAELSKSMQSKLSSNLQ
jgi:hypothetical protein